MSGKEVKSRYEQVVAAAEAKRAAGDHEAADQLMGTAQALVDRDRAERLAMTEADNYARSNARAATKPTGKTKE